MTGKRIYLDYNATTPLLREAAEAAVISWTWPSNPSSVHGFGRDARQKLDDARTSVAQLLGAEGASVVFTASGTEANNLAIRGLVQNINSVAVTSVEHLSLLKPAEKRSAVFIPVDSNGLVRPGALDSFLEELQSRTLVSIQLANNETGVIQPIKELARVVLKHGGFFHCDASQAVGKIPVDFNNLNVDMMTISGHKFGGPVGGAALIVKKGVYLQPQKLGGGQERGYRAGTENVAAIAGMAAALKTALDAPHVALTKQQEALRHYLESEILASTPNAIIFGKNVQRLPNTVCVALQGMNSETQIINFDLAGIAVSSGSACSSGKVSISHVLTAMGVNKKLAECAIRVSMGWETTEDDIKRFIDVWKRNAGKAEVNIEAA